MSRRLFNFERGSDRHNTGGGTSAHYRNAIDIEDAAHAINSINARKRRDGIEQRRVERSAAITLGGGAALAAWLKKDVPE